MNRPIVLRFLNASIASSSSDGNDDDDDTTTKDLFAFLANHEDVRQHIVSYLDPYYCCMRMLTHS